MKPKFLKSTSFFLIAATTIFLIASSCSGPADGQSNFWPDTDGDGFGDGSEDATIFDDDNVPDGWVANNSDCNDNNPLININAIEIADNAIDENCDWFIAITIYLDADGDGFGDPNVLNTFEELLLDAPQFIEENEFPAGFVRNNADCNDDDPAINPLAIDIENDGIDNNCDGNLLVEYYDDLDDDGYGAGNVIPPNPNGPTVGVTNNLDCDDTNPNNFPFNIEIQDGIDNDCDGIIDEFN